MTKFTFPSLAQKNFIILHLIKNTRISMKKKPPHKYQTFSQPPDHTRLFILYPFSRFWHFLLFLFCYVFLCSLLPRAWSTGKKATAITESLSLSGCWPYTKLTDLHSRLLLALLFSHWRVAKMFCCLILDFGKILSLSSI